MIEKYAFQSKRFINLRARSHGSWLKTTKTKTKKTKKLTISDQFLFLIPYRSQPVLRQLIAFCLRRCQVLENIILFLEQIRERFSLSFKNNSFYRFMNMYPYSFL